MVFSVTRTPLSVCVGCPHGIASISVNQIWYFFTKSSLIWKYNALATRYMCLITFMSIIVNIFYLLTIHCCEGLCNDCTSDDRGTSDEDEVCENYSDVCAYMTSYMPIFWTEFSKILKTSYMLIHKGFWQKTHEFPKIFRLQRPKTCVHTFSILAFL